MKLDATLVATLSRWLEATDIDQLELSGPEGSVTLGRAGVAPTHAPAEAAASFDVAAPTLGVFLDRHPLAAQPFAQIGDEVAEGDQLACLQVGPLLTPVRAPKAGIVTECLAEPGALVGYGAKLFRLQSLPPEERG